MIAIAADLARVAAVLVVTEVDLRIAAALVATAAGTGEAIVVETAAASGPT